MKNFTLLFAFVASHWVNALSAQADATMAQIGLQSQNNLSHFTQRTPSVLTPISMVENVITGSVTDNNGEALVGVNIQVKGTSRGVLTDLDGNFKVAAQKGDVLVFSFVGYKTQEVTITDEAVALKIKLDDGAALELVTVVGSRGKARTDVERPVPVDVINAKELQITGQTELGQMAQFSSPSFNSAKYGINGVANYADPATLRGMSPD